MVKPTNILLTLYGMAAATSLACEAIWMKQLSLLMGMSHHATAATMAIFILGIAWGAGLVARLSHCSMGLTSNARFTVNKMFAMIQFALAVWNLSLPTLFQWVDGLYLTFAPAQQNNMHQMVRMLGATLILLPPSILMGMVFPLISRTGVRRVYPVGMIGSVLGVLLLGLLLEPILGMRQTMYLLAGINALVGAIAWWLPSIAFESSQLPQAAEPQTASRKMIFIASLLGASLFMAESVWFKLLWLIVDATSYAQVMILASVLLAMFLGAMISWRWQLPITLLLILTAITNLTVIFLTGLLAQFWHTYATTWQAGFTSYLTGLFILACALVALPSLCMGALIPRLCIGLSNTNIAKLWCWHHLGCAAGAILGAWLIIPIAGVTGTLAIASALVCLPLLKKQTWPIAIILLGVSAMAGFRGDATFQDQFTHNTRKIIFHYEDASGIIEVYQNLDDNSLSLTSSRKRQEGGNQPDQVLMERLQGQLPLELCTKRDNILIIGMGTGTSLGASLTPDVKQLTCVEISKGVIKASNFFKDANQNVLADPRVKIVQQDGRNFIKLTNEKYDLIVQELFFPYRMGVASLYAQEHYQRCKTKLKPSGYFAQWISLGQIGPQEFKTLAHTFQSVFDITTLWIAGGYVMFIGGQNPLSIQADNPMLAHFMTSHQALTRLAFGAPLNTENHLVIESSLPRMVKQLNTTELAVSNLAMLSGIEQPVTVLNPQLPHQTWQAASLVRKAIIARQNQHNSKAIELYQQAYALDTNNEQAQRALKEHYIQQQDFNRLLAIDPLHPDAMNNQGLKLYKQGKMPQAIRCLKQVLNSHPKHVAAMFNLANCYARSQQYQQAVLLYQQVLNLNSKHAKALHNLMQVQRKLQLTRKVF